MTREVRPPDRVPELRLAFDSVAVPVIAVDVAGRVLVFNRSAETLTGFRAEEVLGCPAGVILQPAADARPVPFFEALLSRTSGSYRCPVRTADGGSRVVSWAGRLIQGGEGEMSIMVATGTDVTQRQALEESRMERLRSLAEIVPALIWAVDRTGTVTMITGRAVADLPHECRPSSGASIFALESVYPEFIAQVRRALSGEAFSDHIELAGGIWEARYEPLRDRFGTITGVAGVATDVTAQRTTERDLAQAQKMESLGVMAGSVAHDFNNLLTAILGFAGVLKLAPGLDDEDREHLYLIEQSARRGADIASRLLAFSRGGLARFVPVDLREVTRETITLVAPTLHDRLRVEAELPGAAVQVEGDFGQLQQALLNIILNARDVLPEDGCIGISLSATEDIARLTVSDDGPGMSDEVRRRIFEPFYTTKSRGSGTGLGLSITYGIVQGHHGEIEVDSRPGSGTTFSLTFPILREVTPQVPQEMDAGEGTLVLLVDDDDLVRRATSSSLMNLGYNVVEVGTGPLAVDLIRARPGRFAAILLDLVMPGMGGRDVFHAVQAVRPDLPVIVCTGYAAAAHIDDAMKRAIAGLLQKPFSPERLEAALRSVGAEPVRPARTVAGVR